MASSLATESQEPVASAVTETSRPTVDRRVSTRLQPLSEMRRVTGSNGDCGCVELTAITQEVLKGRRVVRRGDDQDLANTRQHQRGQRTVDHRLVIKGAELFAYTFGDGKIGRASWRERVCQ